MMRTVATFVALAGLLVGQPGRMGALGHGHPALPLRGTIPARVASLAQHLSARIGAGDASCTPWQAVPSPHVIGTLRAVAAVFATDIWAVGNDSSGTLTTHWDGVRWQIVASPTPARGSFYRLFSVAATSSHDIWAVGDVTGNISQPLIEHWDGVQWRVVPDGTTMGGLDSFSLQAVTTISATDAWAVGGTNGGGQPLLEHWNGRQWQAVRGANLGPDGGLLHAVAAISSDDVWAAGFAIPGNFAAVIEHWDGSRWRVVPSPPIKALDSDLSALAALSAHDVWAVGGFGDDPAPGATLIEHWDGHRWRVVPSPQGLPTGLWAVAAVAARDVWAVGAGLTAHWDGTRWSAVSDPTHSSILSLAAISPGNLWGLVDTEQGQAVQVEHSAEIVCQATPVGQERVRLASAIGARGDLASGYGPSSALALDPDHERAYVANPDGTVNILDLHNVQIQRTFRDSTGPVLRSAALMAIDTNGATGRPRLILAHPAERATAGAAHVVSVQAGFLDIRDGVTGALLRHVAGLHPSAVAVDTRNDRIIVAEGRTSAVTGSATQGNVRILDGSPTHLGALVQTVAISNPVALAVDEGADRFFVRSNTGITALDATTGSIVGHAQIGGQWTGNVPADVVGPMVVDSLRGRLFVAQASIDHETLDMSALDALSPSDSSPSRQMAVRYTTQVLDDRSGSAAPGSMAIDPQAQRLFVVTSAMVNVVDEATGDHVAWSAFGAGPTALAVNEQAGRVYVACLIPRTAYGQRTATGAVIVLNASDGSQLAAVPVSAGPAGIAVDPRSGRIIVLHQGGVTFLDAHAGDIHRLPPMPWPTAPATPVPGDVYNAHTRHTLGGAFLAFYHANGGFDAFGYPRTEPFMQDAHWVQYTDRFALELDEGHVHTLLLGHLLTSQRTFPRVAAVNSTRSRIYFSTTGHTLSGRFLSFWQAHHGDLLLGAPISEVTGETNGDGTGHLYGVQWFENGRLEYHPELAHTRYAVLIGLTGKQVLQQKGWLPR